MSSAEPTIEELCRPLSAKVMPKRAQWALSGQPLTEEEALNSQRKAANTKMLARRRRAKKEQKR